MYKIRIKPAVVVIFVLVMFAFSATIGSCQSLSDNYTYSGHATETVGATLLGFLGLGHHPRINLCNPRIILVPRSLKSVQGLRLSRITDQIVIFLAF